jgi:transposase-like protein
MNYNDIDDETFIQIIEKSTSWNDVLVKCFLKTRTRNFERRIQRLQLDVSKLPTNFGGLYSKIGKHTDEYYKDLIAKNTNWDDVLIGLGFKSLQIIKNFKLHLDNIQINYNHLSYPKILTSTNEIPLNEILIDNSTYGSMPKLKQKLIKQLNWPEECSCCKKSEHHTYLDSIDNNGRIVKIPLEIDHIDGKHDNNKIQNLRFICPNCHALTDTYKGKNMKVTKDNKIKTEQEKQNTIQDSRLKYKEKYKEKCKDGRYKCIDCKTTIYKNNGRCMKCSNINKTKQTLNIIDINDIPSYYQLQQDLIELKSYTSIALKYESSPDTIKKWIEFRKKVDTIVTIDFKFNCKKCNKNKVIKEDILCVSCIDAEKNKNKLNRPSIEIIEEDYKELKTYAEVARKWSVTGKTIKIWLLEQLVTNRKDIHCNTITMKDEIKEVINDVIDNVITKIANDSKIVNTIVKIKEEKIDKFDEIRVKSLLEPPTLQQLQEDIKELSTYREIGKKYCVSRVTIANWLKKYGIVPKEKIEEEEKVCIHSNCSNEVYSTGASCHICLSKEKFKKAIIDRPSLEQLEKDLIELKSFVQVAKKYDVSDNCIRKWIAKYHFYQKHD